jgi:hypothetical protein
VALKNNIGSQVCAAPNLASSSDWSSGKPLAGIENTPVNPEALGTRRPATYPEEKSK